MGLTEIRRQITDLVGNGAVGMVEATMDEAGKGHYLGMKYLFETIGLYPATSPDDASVPAILMRTVGIPGSAGAGIKSYQRFPGSHSGIRGCFRMKVSSWATAASRWSQAADRLSATFGSCTRTRTRRSVTDPPLLRGAFRMDMTWVTGRIAVGGGIWTAENMATVARSGVTHIIDMQIEFDDTHLAVPLAIEVLWNPIDDDFQPKPPEIFQRGVEFATEALEQDGTKLFIHCAAGVHRAPMMTLAVLCSLGWTPAAAQDLIEKERPVVDFADVYLRSVERFLDQQVRAE